MNIPNFIDTQVINKDGFLTDVWKQILTQLFTELQVNLSNEGYIVPKQSSSSVNLLNGVKYTGALVYNEDTNKLMANINGTFVEVQTL